MPLTVDEIESFNRFVHQKLANGGAESLRELAAEWEERQQVNAAIREGINAIDEGRVRPFDESQEEFRRLHNLPPGQ